MTELTASASKADVNKVTRLFQDISSQDIAHLFGRVDLLQLKDCCLLLPEVVETVENLELMKTPFG